MFLIKRAAFLPLALIGIAACSDAPSAPVVSVELPSAPGPVLAEFRVEVDAVNNTMRFEPIVVGSRTALRPNGLSLATYGTQNSDVRLFNGPVTMLPVGTRKQYSADVGLVNLKTLAIGDEELSGGAAPRDTMGIFVFQSNPVIACQASPCDVTIFNQHGTGTFTAPNQKYFWYRDRVLAGDTTRANSGCEVATAGYRGCKWVFDASLTTVSFNFFVQVRAAWEPVVGGDTEFPIVYEGDSLPEARAEPRWDMVSRSTSSTNWVVTEGTALSIIQTGGTPNVRREYIRRDAIGATGVGFIEASMHQTTTSTKPGAFVIGYFGIDDNTKFLGVGMSQTQVGFITSAFDFIAGSTTAITTNTRHTYKLVKNGTGNVELFIDGNMTPALSLPYTSSSWSASVALPTNDYSFQFFGHRAGTNNVGTDPPGNTWTTFWDQIVYKIGGTS